MSSSNQKFNYSRNLGFLTGPLLIIMGIVGFVKNFNPFLSGMLIVLGIIRLGLTFYSLWLSKKEQSDL